MIRLGIKLLIICFSVHGGGISSSLPTLEQAIQKTKTFKQIEDKFWMIMPVGQTTVGKVVAVYYVLQYHSIDAGKIMPLHYKDVDVSLQYNYDNGGMNVAVRYHKEF